MRRRSPPPYEPIIRGPLRLDRAWSYDLPPASEPTLDQQIRRMLMTAARWNELQKCWVGLDLDLAAEE
jgi:hypothetical protein